MRLSTRARYALQIMVAVARMGKEDEPVSLAKVAKHTRISHRYLEKLVSALKTKNLLRPVAGRSGGYLLTRPPEEIRIGQIIEAGIGPINIVKCVKKPESCWKTEFCDCRPIYMLINQRIAETLNEYSLLDMIDGKWRDRIAQQMESDIEAMADEPAEPSCTS